MTFHQNVEPEPAKKRKRNHRRAILKQGQRERHCERTGNTKLLELIKKSPNGTIIDKIDFIKEFDKLQAGLKREALGPVTDEDGFLVSYPIVPPKPVNNERKKQPTASNYKEHRKRNEKIGKDSASAPKGPSTDSPHSSSSKPAKATIPYQEYKNRKLQSKINSIFN